MVGVQKRKALRERSAETDWGSGQLERALENRDVVCGERTGSGRIADPQGTLEECLVTTQ